MTKAKNPNETAAYAASHGAIVAGHAAYWVEGRWVVGIALHQRPGDEKHEPAAPWTVAMWAEIQRLRAEVAVRGDENLRRLDAEREAMQVERDDAQLEIARLRGVAADAEGRLRALLDFNPGPAGMHPVPWTTKPRLTEVADLLAATA
jgi:hypothetical protein